MKILVISDTHGNIVRLRHVLGFAERFDVSALVHCGDWDNAEIVGLIREVKIPVYGVLGNADEVQYNEILRELKGAGVEVGEVDVIKTEFDGKRTVIGHQPFKVAEYITSGDFDLVFHGHTHQRKDKFFGKTRVINPGAIHNTKEPSFAIYDTKSDKVEFIDIEI